MNYVAEYINHRFGHLTLLHTTTAAPASLRGSRWVCRCDCGRPVTAWFADLRKMTSCGRVSCPYD